MFSCCLAAVLMTKPGTPVLYKVVAGDRAATATFALGSSGGSSNVFATLVCGGKYAARAKVCPLRFPSELLGIFTGSVVRLDR